MNDRNFKLTSAGEANLTAALTGLLADWNAVSGTIHFLDAETGELMLAAHVGIPAEMLNLIRRIPIGKGMAGLAAQRREPVQLCNLQTDTTETAKPGAKSAPVRGAIAVPIWADENIVGVLGIAMPTQHVWTDAEGLSLMEIARRLTAARANF